VAKVGIAEDNRHGLAARQSPLSKCFPGNSFIKELSQFDAWFLRSYSPPNKNHCGREGIAIHDYDLP